MKRKRKPYFPPSRGPKAPAPLGGPAGSQSTTTVAIDVNARSGRGDILVGSRVTILGTGLYAGQTGVVERLITGGIHAALVRVETGGSRRVRTVDLRPVGPVRPETGTADAAPGDARDLREAAS